jgi:phospholipase C
VTTVSRRQVLGAGLVAGAGALTACSSGKRKGGSSTTTAASSVVASAPSTTCSPLKSRLSQIEHVVFLIQENRSFDHYFGSYRGVRGFDDHPSGSNGVFAQPARAGGSGVVLPFHLDTATTNAACTNDINHDWGPQHRYWNGGAMDGWASVHAAVDGVDGGVNMGYYARADLPYYYALADGFTLCDAYHCSVLGPTHANRLFSLSATNDPTGVAGGPILNNPPDLPSTLKAQFSKTWTSMPEQLEANGVSWKVYDNPKLVTLPFAVGVTNNLLYYFKRYADPSTALYKNAFTWSVDDFATDVQSGNLPSVTWVCSQPGQDEHPPASPEVGEAFISKVVNTLTANPTVWAKTVVFATYDENGGFFDHVAPPVAPPGTAGEEVTVSPLPGDAGGFARPVGLGFRVPMLVISPFSRGGYVCSDTFDHTSLLRFLETRFGVEVPNLSAWRRSVTGDLTTTLDLTTPDTSMPPLPTARADDPVVLRECPAHEIITPVGHYPVPANPAMPTQETGAAKRRPATASC